MELYLRSSVTIEQLTSVIAEQYEKAQLSYERLYKEGADAFTANPKNGYIWHLERLVFAQCNMEIWQMLDERARENDLPRGIRSLLNNFLNRTESFGNSTSVNSNNTDKLEAQAYSTIVRCLRDNYLEAI